MKILQVGPLPPPVGGMATVVEHLASGLAGRCELRVLNNVKTTAVDRRLIQGLAAQLGLLWRLAGLCALWRPQIVHIHTCSWLSFWRSSLDVLVARALGRRVVLHIHGGEFKRFLESLRPFQARLARRVLGACAQVIVLGQGWKGLLDGWCGPGRVAIVPNGVPVEPRRRPVAGAPFTVICLAAYDRSKGQADLLQAAAGLRATGPIRVALLGPESVPGQRQALLDLAAGLDLADSAEIPGPAVGAHKDAWWARADCFCLPSYFEGLPMSMLEAMARGVPVVATRVGAIPESATDGREALLYAPGDVTALATHLQSLRDAPALAERLGSAGRERLIRDFSLERSVERLLAVYRRALAEGC